MNRSIELIFENNWEQLHNCGSCTLNTILEFFEDKNRSSFLNSLEMYDDAGNYDMTCGAIIGINMAFGRILQNYDLTADEIKEKMHQFRMYFEEKHSSINCFNILKQYKIGETIEINSPECQEKCHDLVRDSILQALEILHEDTDPLLPVKKRYESM